MEREEFVGSRQAASLLNCAPHTLRRRIVRGEVQTFIDPMDSRRKLIRVTDLEPLRRPRPASREHVAETAA